jgi:PEP-CTERM putative exosortase interaction domain
VTITGGSGSGSLQFSAQVDGTVDVGAIAGGFNYQLAASTVHPTQLVSSTAPFQLNPPPWALDAATPIASFSAVVSPYNDPANQFLAGSGAPSNGIPSIPSEYSLGGDMGFPTPDLVLTPGANQHVNVTLHGTLNFTYGEAFYLIAGFGTTLFDPQSFTTFGSPSSLPPDGSGATSLDFSNSANLVQITLPASATASFASGNAYNVTAVPEPETWILLLAGIGMVGWGTRRRR